MPAIFFYLVSRENTYNLTCITEELKTLFPYWSIIFWIKLFRKPTIIAKFVLFQIKGEFFNN